MGGDPISSIASWQRPHLQSDIRASKVHQGWNFWTRCRQARQATSSRQAGMYARMCAYVGMYACMYVCMYRCTLCTYMHVSGAVCTYIHIYLPTYLHTSMHASLYKPLTPIYRRFEVQTRRRMIEIRPLPLCCSKGRAFSPCLQQRLPFGPFPVGDRTICCQAILFWCSFISFGCNVSFVG